MALNVLLRKVCTSSGGSLLPHSLLVLLIPEHADGVI